VVGLGPNLEELLMDFQESISPWLKWYKKVWAVVWPPYRAKRDKAYLAFGMRWVPEAMKNIMETGVGDEVSILSKSWKSFMR
jgi:hypothetical protein